MGGGSGDERKVVDEIVFFSLSIFFFPISCTVRCRAYLWLRINAHTNNGLSLDRCRNVKIQAFIWRQHTDVPRMNWNSKSLSQSVSQSGVEIQSRQMPLANTNTSRCWSRHSGTAIVFFSLRFQSLTHIPYAYNHSVAIGFYCLRPFHGIEHGLNAMNN